MEELRVIETTDGREFKPWASVDDVVEIRSDVNMAVVGISESIGNIETAITAIIGDYAEQLHTIIGD